MNTPNKAKPPLGAFCFITAAPQRLRVLPADPKPERKTEYVWKPGNKRMVRENISLR
jgi:hypothetical protein